MDVLSPLCQSELLTFVSSDNIASDSLVVYKQVHHNRNHLTIFPVLLPLDAIEKQLSRSDWGFASGFHPGISLYGDIPVYQRYSVEDNIEPFIIERSFNGLREGFIQLSEEFTLFHNLFLTGNNPKTFLKYDKYGRQQLVCTLSDDVLEVRKRCIDEFLSAKQYSLMLCLNSIKTVFSDIDINNFQRDLEEYRNENYYYTLVRYKSRYSENSYQSRLLGKTVIWPKPIENCNLWPFDSEHTFEEFIIDVDDVGEPVKFTCDPGELANYFGKNPENPQYLTPVMFSRDVLEKYYRDDSKYEVTDFHVKCGSLWSIPIDSNVKDRVVVYLGDLGQRLDHVEQLYWKQFNLTEKGKISSVAWSRDFKAECAPPLEHASRLIYLFKWFQTTHKQEYGFSLFKPLERGDEFRVKTLRIPISSGWSEFDEQITTLSKLLVESINLKEIKSKDRDICREYRTIKTLGTYLEHITGKEKNPEFNIVLIIDNLRQGTAHMKGAKYYECFSEFGYTFDDKQQFLEQIITLAIQFIIWLEQLLIPEALHAPK